MHDIVLQYFDDIILCSGISVQERYRVQCAVKLQLARPTVTAEYPNIDETTIKISYLFVVVDNRSYRSSYCIIIIYIISI